MQTTTVYQQVFDLLRNTHCSYLLIDHQQTRSAFEAAKVAGAKPQEVIKALLLIADTLPVLVIVRGDRKIDMKTLKKLKKIKDLRFASPEEVLEYTHCPVGSVPPFGNALGLETLGDDAINDMPEVVFAPGVDTQSIRMKKEDFLGIAKPELLPLGVTLLDKP